MSTIAKKFSISLGSSSLFLILNLSNSYELFGKIINKNLINNKCPTELGLLLNAFIFFIITYLSMGDPFKDQLFKLKNTTYGTLIFYMISSPAIYYLTNLIFNRNDLCPSLPMIILHSIIYGLILFGVMYFPE